jgi:hypothetical protein
MLVSCMPLKKSGGRLEVRIDAGQRGRKWTFHQGGTSSFWFATMPHGPGTMLV